ncbi:hypothetical protein TNCV_4422751 [Trichonephila clavipes]|nr:hypothetical protein TNCV_4422751 [Trichonephila clavipes]
MFELKMIDVSRSDGTNIKKKAAFVKCSNSNYSLLWRVSYEGSQLQAYCRQRFLKICSERKIVKVVHPNRIAVPKIEGNLQQGATASVSERIARRTMVAKDLFESLYCSASRTFNTCDPIFKHTFQRAPLHTITMY